MQTKTIVIWPLSLSPDELSNSRLKATVEPYALEYFGQELVSETNLHLKRTFELRQVAALPSLRKFNESLPGLKKPGFFMNYGWPPTFSPALDFQGRKLVQKDTEQFHDSESVDVFDLYNACNGIMRGDFLDVEQLNNYTPDEAEELNVARLREIWEHTKTGCLQCREIIQALDTVRHTVSDVAEHIDPKDGPESDIDEISSIS